MLPPWCRFSPKFIYFQPKNVIVETDRVTWYGYYFVVCFSNMNCFSVTSIQDFNLKFPSYHYGSPGRLVTLTVLELVYLMPHMGTDETYQ